MREIDAGAGPIAILSRIRVLALRLKSRPDTAPLAANVDAARLDLKSRYDTWENCRDATVAATGAVVFADDMEDSVVADVARRAKVLVDGQIRSPQYVRLFASAPSELTRGTADEAQTRLALHLAQQLETNPDYASLRDLVPELKAARDEVAAAQKARADRENEEAAAWNELQIAEQRCREVYRDTYPQLLTLFPGKKRLVESFFYQERRKKKNDEPATPTPE